MMIALMIAGLSFVLDRRQWMAIGILSGILIVVIILLFAL